MTRATNKKPPRKSPLCGPNANTQTIALMDPSKFVLKLRPVKPITRTQKSVFDTWRAGKNLWLTGCAGTGKTFVSFFLALEELEREDTPYKCLVIIRSVVPVRDIGALPGGVEEKVEVYEEPYVDICEQLYDNPKAYSKLKNQGTIRFEPTSYLRGRTLSDAIVIVDESSNLNFHELDSTITRAGGITRYFYCGDEAQSDFVKSADRNGYEHFEDIVHEMKSFEIIEFLEEDIVRGPLVKEYLLAKNRK